ncbi:MAG: hypothetical protein A2V90_00335 [Gammaproteobacteria bacterium RBG_16_57_12]|nr:MAG: hypothetical protein A2V90_00335 [Gammaproteobacteria bacterium RBG_16_57_12]
MYLLILLGSLVSASGWAQLQVLDDQGNAVILEQPARRMISLAPHTTELLFAAGAGDAVVGVSSYSDYPPAAKTIPRIGDANNLDIERILALQPDLVVVWGSGTSRRQLDRLQSLGFKFYISEPHTLEQMIASIERLGVLAGTTPVAQDSADKLHDRLDQLRRQNSGQRTIRVFYQVWHEPLMTINAAHFINDAITLCGGVNIFADLPALVPQLDQEAVLLADPEVIIGAIAKGQEISAVEAWRSWPDLQAVRLNNLYTIDADLISRPTPRLLDAAEDLCEMLAQVRAKH